MYHIIPSIPIPHNDQQKKLCPSRPELLQLPNRRTPAICWPCGSTIWAVFQFPNGETSAICRPCGSPLIWKTPGCGVISSHYLKNETPPLFSYEYRNFIFNNLAKSQKKCFMCPKILQIFSQYIWQKFGNLSESGSCQRPLQGNARFLQRVQRANLLKLSNYDD